jgi:hypothetical protein
MKMTVYGSVGGNEPRMRLMLMVLVLSITVCAFGGGRPKANGDDHSEETGEQQLRKRVLEIEAFPRKS